MRRAFRSIRATLLASFSFVGTLVERHDKVATHSEAGFPILAGWEFSAEEKLVEAARKSQVSSAPARAALCCVEGAHKGEVFLLSKDVESLGPGIQHSIVLTPRSESEAEQGFYQIELGNINRILTHSAHPSANPGVRLRINGKQELESELYDFDELDLLGNRFLFLDLQRNTATSPGVRMEVRS